MYVLLEGLGYSRFYSKVSEIPWRSQDTAAFCHDFDQMSCLCCGSACHSKYQNSDGLTNRNFFLTLLGSSKSKILVLVSSFPDEPSLGLEHCLLAVSLHNGKSERQQAVLSLLVTALIPFMTL